MVRCLLQFGTIPYEIVQIPLKAKRLSLWLVIQTIHAFNSHYFIEFHRDLLSFFSIRLIYKFFYKQRIFFQLGLGVAELFNEFSTCAYLCK